MRVFKAESHDRAHGLALGASGAGAALLAIALSGTHTRGLVVVLTVSLMACLLWQIAWFARRRTASLPRDPHAAMHTVEVHVGRVGHLKGRLGTPSRE